MKKKMIMITIVLSIAFAVALPVYLVMKNEITETIAITIGVTLYHFAVRLAIGYSVDGIMKNNANPNNAWFREKKFEAKFYKFIRIRKWKKHLPTYSPSTFDPNGKTVEEIVGATCQAEVVHEVIMVFSLIPIAFIPLLGAPWAFIITSILAMLFDSLFVLLQRYNRPKLIRVMKRFAKIPKQG